ncbi:PH domain-containing protein [Actinoplanes philippinensis]|uniref:PH domain-containing protein n=1 Tax=Actinoplanes philippinensis TaxID=35752 RepID=UPI0033D05F40
MAKKFNPPPGWPEAPGGWLPAEGWQPDPSWPPAPPGWQLVVELGDPDTLWSAKGMTLTGLGGGKYRLTSTLLYFEKGIVSTNAQQVPVAHIIDVDMRQAMVQKARGVGNVLVHVQRASSIEIVVLEDVPEPRTAVAIINETARLGRLREQQLHNTHHYAGMAAHQPMAMAAPAATAAAPAPVDPMEQLRRLGELRQAGLVTDDEFTSKKSEILARL